MAQTSDRISSIAGRYGTITEDELEALVRGGAASVIANDIRSMAASLRRQDEHKGLRGLLKRIAGK